MVIHKKLKYNCSKVLDNFLLYNFLIANEIKNEDEAFIILIKDFVNYSFIHYKHVLKTIKLFEDNIQLYDDAYVTLQSLCIMDDISSIINNKTIPEDKKLIYINRLLQANGMKKLAKRPPQDIKNKPVRVRGKKNMITQFDKTSALVNSRTNKGLPELILYQNNLEELSRFGLPRDKKNYNKYKLKR